MAAIPAPAFLNDSIDASTILLLGLLLFLGHKLVDQKAAMHLLGKRIAFGAFLFFVVVTAFDRRPADAAAWVAILVRSLIFAGILLGAVWTILPAGGFVYVHTIEMMIRRLGKLATATRHRAEQRKAERERSLRDAEWERQRPEREQAARESAAKAEAETAVTVAAQKRRDDARAECELAYALAAPEIVSRFSKQEFTAFAAKYLSDSFPPEIVEGRAEQLKSIIRQHQEKVVPPRKFRSIQELAVWFEQQKAEIEAVTDARHRATLLVQLRERYSELTSELLAEMTP